MAELSKRNPIWPAGLPQEPEDPAAATQPNQFEEIAALANSLGEAADHLPGVAGRIAMSAADRAGFLAEARTLREQAAELQAAANRRSIEQMQRTMEGINSTCISCHSRYRDFSGQLNRTQALIGRGDQVSRAAVTCRITLSQSPMEGWRNSRIVGYQGLSFRSGSQRQSATNGSSTQTGLPIAPARWATAVSTAITRSRLAINAAVSVKS
jgi:hypothetical protein